MVSMVCIGSVHAAARVRGRTPCTLCTSLPPEVELIESEPEGVRRDGRAVQHLAGEGRVEKSGVEWSGVEWSGVE